MTVLLLTNRLDYTADYVVLEFQRRKLDYVRFNTEDFPTRIKIDWSITDQVTDGYLVLRERKIAFTDISSVWYRRPVAPIPSATITQAVARDFAINELRAALFGILHSLNCSWVSHPSSLLSASYKIVQLETAVRLGFSVPRTLITNIIDEATGFFNDFRMETIYKPLSVSRIQYPDEVKQMFTNKLGPEHQEFLHQVDYAPVQFQRFIDKELDIRITVIGKLVFAVAIHSQQGLDTRVDWRKGDVRDLQHDVFELPDDIETKCKSLVDQLGLRFGAIDMVLDKEGNFYFLEINSNGQWAWIEHLTGLPLTSALVDLLSENDD